MPDFCGHPVAVLENEQLRLEYLTDVGPRLARLMAFGAQQSLLAELPGPGMETDFGRFAFMGGHRLWRAPETIPETYIPDQPVAIEALENGVRLAAGVEPSTGIAKRLDIQLLDGAAVKLTHRLINQGEQSVELAPWAISIFRLGGRVTLPQPQGAVDPNGLLPNRQLVLWPYTQLNDARLSLADDFVRLEARPALPPCKLGYFNRAGWAAYWLDGVLLVKRFEVLTDARYPDKGCNVEAYCNDQFVELETLGPLVRLAPGEHLEHVERWELYAGVEKDALPEGLTH